MKPNEPNSNASKTVRYDGFLNRCQSKDYRRLIPILVNRWRHHWAGRRAMARLYIKAISGYF